MKRYSELLYWHGFSDLIHGEEDEKGYYYMYDPGLPVRARKSFENWLRENDKKQFKNTMKHNYHSEDQPQTTYAEALEIASEIKEDIEVCIEFEKAFVFKAHDDVYQGGGYQFTSLVLYVFEINIRASVVLGLVGAGGIGLILNQQLGFYNYPNAMMIIILIFVVVIVIEYISTKIREALL